MFKNVLGSFSLDGLACNNQIIEGQITETSGEDGRLFCVKMINLLGFVLVSLLPLNCGNWRWVWMESSHHSVYLLSFMAFYTTPNTQTREARTTRKPSLVCSLYDSNSVKMQHQTLLFLTGSHPMHSLPLWSIDDPTLPTSESRRKQHQFCHMHVSWCIKWNL